MVEHVLGDASSHGLQDVNRELRKAFLTSASSTFILHGVGGCGKSKFLPGCIASLVVGKVLVTTPVKIDVEDIARWAPCPTYWQVGGRKSGGSRSSRLHVVTMGLLVNLASL